MASTNKTSLGLNKWEASDKPVRQDFVNDNIIVDEKIAKLNSDLVAVSNTVTNITSATVGSVSCLKVGKLVQISYGTNTTLTAGNWILLATLPSGYRPQIQSYGDFPWNNTSGIVRIETNGNISLNVGSATTETVRFTITFLVP